MTSTRTRTQNLVSYQQHYDYRIGRLAQSSQIVHSKNAHCKKLNVNGPIYGPALLLLLAACDRGTAKIDVASIDDGNGNNIYTISGEPAENKASARVIENFSQSDMFVLPATVDKIVFNDEGKNNDVLLQDSATDNAKIHAVLKGYGRKVEKFELYLVSGTDEANTLVVTPGKEGLSHYFLGGAGNDIITGGVNKDWIYGQAGNDVLIGGSRNDFLSGGTGDDILDGGPGRSGVDTLDGGAGNDTVTYTGITQAFVRTSSINITVNVDNGIVARTVLPADITGVYINLSRKVNNGYIVQENKNSDASGERLISIENLIGSDYKDVLVGDKEVNILSGGAGDDILIGGLDDDTLNGGADADTLNGGAGADRLDGGAGSDIVFYVSSTAGVTVNLSDVTDATNDNATLTNSQTGGDAEGDVLSNIENIIGSAHNDTLTGNALANILTGGGGADRLDGGAGAGRDTVSYVGSTASVTVNLSDVTDATNDDATLTKSQIGGDAEGDVLSNIENIIGSAHDDTLTGNAVVNMLTGGRGADTLDGGRGADRLDGGAERDTVTYANSNAGVRVNLSNVTDATDDDATLTKSQTGGDAEGDVLSNIENIIGSAHNDTLTGNALGNILTGGRGIDTLDGGGGADRLDGGTEGDTVTYANSTAGVRVNLSYVTDATNDDPTLTKSQTGGDAHGDVLSNIENIIGSAHNDILTGNAAANILAGGGGVDTLDGGGGSDRLTGGGGADNFVLNLASSGTDTIIDFVSGTDKILIDTTNGNESSLTALGLVVKDSGVHVNIVNSSDNNIIYLTLINIDHNDITFVNFDVI